MPAADFCPTVGVDCSTLSPDSGTCGRPPVIRTTAFDAQPPESTSSALDGCGLRCTEPARPALQASYPMLVHRLASLLRASFRPRLATTPLRFAITSPHQDVKRTYTSKLSFMHGVLGCTGGVPAARAKHRSSTPFAHRGDASCVRRGSGDPRYSRPGGRRYKLVDAPGEKCGLRGCDTSRRYGAGLRGSRPAACSRAVRGPG
jgi:hypothetical protein